MAGGVAAARIVFGLGFIATPGWTGRIWIGRDADRPAVKVLTQAIGARDLTMGLGALIAMRRGKHAQGWMQAIAITDLIDFAYGAAAKDRIPPSSRAAVLVLAGVSAAQAAYAATGVAG